MVDKLKDEKETPPPVAITKPVPPAAKKAILFEETVLCKTLTKYNCPVVAIENVNPDTDKAAKPDLQPVNVMKEVTELQLATETPPDVMPQIKVNIISLENVKLVAGKNYKLILIEA